MSVFAGVTGWLSSSCPPAIVTAFTKHGGTRASAASDSSVTHYISDAPDSPTTTSLHASLLSPFRSLWIDDSVRAGQQLPLTSYLLPPGSAGLNAVDWWLLDQDKIAQEWRGGLERSRQKLGINNRGRPKGKPGAATKSGRSHARQTVDDDDKKAQGDRDRPIDVETDADVTPARRGRGRPRGSGRGRGGRGGGSQQRGSVSSQPAPEDEEWEWKGPPRKQRLLDEDEQDARLAGKKTGGRAVAGASRKARAEDVDDEDETRAAARSTSQQKPRAPTTQRQDDMEPADGVDDIDADFQWAGPRKQLRPQPPAARSGKDEKNDEDEEEDEEDQPLRARPGRGRGGAAAARGQPQSKRSPTRSTQSAPSLPALQTSSRPSRAAKDKGQQQRRVAQMVEDEDDRDAVEAETEEDVIVVSGRKNVFVSSAVVRQRPISLTAILPYPNASGSRELHFRSPRGQQQQHMDEDEEETEEEDDAALEGKYDDEEDDEELAVVEVEEQLVAVTEDEAADHDVLDIDADFEWKGVPSRQPAARGKPPTAARGARNKSRAH